METLLRFKAVKMEFIIYDDGLIKLYKDANWVQANWFNEWIGLGILNEFPATGDYRWDNIINEIGGHVYWLPVPHNNI